MLGSVVPCFLLVKIVCSNITHYNANLQTRTSQGYMIHIRSVMVQVLEHAISNIKVTAAICVVDRVKNKKGNI